MVVAIFESWVRYVEMKQKNPPSPLSSHLHPRKKFSAPVRSARTEVGDLISKFSTSRCRSAGLALAARPDPAALRPSRQITYQWPPPRRRKPRSAPCRNVCGRASPAPSHAGARASGTAYRPQPSRRPLSRALSPTRTAREAPGPPLWCAPPQVARRVAPVNSPVPRRLLVPSPCASTRSGCATRQPPKSPSCSRASARSRRGRAATRRGSASASSRVRRRRSTAGTGTKSTHAIPACAKRPSWTSSRSCTTTSPSASATTPSRSACERCVARG